MNRVIGCALVALVSSGAIAGSVDYDASLDFVGGSFLDGVVGDGISNANFVRAQGNGIEVGLKAIERFVGDLSNNNERYMATVGTSESPSGLVGSTWNYVLALDLGSNTISDYNIELRVDFDAGEGVTDFVTLNYTAALEGFGLGGLSTFGDSQNLLFSFWQNDLGAPAFDPSAVGEYELELTIRDRVTGDLEAQVNNTVSVVPLPAAAWAGLGVMGTMIGVRTIRRR